MTKKIDVIPQEVFDAVKVADFRALAEYRESLDGDEVISARDTLPIFDWMIQHLTETTPAERREIDILRDEISKANTQRRLADVIAELERVSLDRFERELQKKSPALYTMRKLMFGSAPVGPDRIRVADGAGRSRSVIPWFWRS